MEKSFLIIFKDYSHLGNITELFPVTNKMINAQSSYLLSYENFIQYFKNCKEITEYDFYISTNFTYGWMPTILNYKSKNIQECVKLLNIVKKGIKLSKHELEILKTTINNSIVGTSKLLHFINPELYAIWDSRACNFLYGKTYKTNKIDSFLEYMKICNEIRNLDTNKDIVKLYAEKFGYKVSSYRAIEQIIYLNGGFK